MKVFVSHSSDEKELYSDVRNALKTVDAEVWDESDMNEGKWLADQLAKATRDCEQCIFVATPRSTESKWCLAELGAFWGAGKTVIPFVPPEGGLDKSDLPPILQGKLFATDTNSLALAIRSQRNSLTQRLVHAAFILASVIILAYVATIVSSLILSRLLPDTPIVVAAGAMIVDFRNNEYVMLGVLHTPEDRGIVFSPPAGRSKNGEGPKETALRETLEETGYTIRNIVDLGKAPAGNPNFSLVRAELDRSVPQKTYVHDDTAGIIWANPTRVPLSNWRFPEQREWIVGHFEEIVAELERGEVRQKPNNNTMHPEPPKARVSNGAIIPAAW